VKTIKGKIKRMKKPEPKTISLNDIEKMKKILEYYFKKYGKIPKLSYIKEETGLDKNSIYKILSYLKNKKFLLVENNKLTISQLPDKIKKLPVKKVVNKIKQKKDTVKLDVTQFKKPVIKFNNWISILKYILLVIGIGATYMSVYYSDNWLREFLSPFRSLLLATIMVAFAVSAFELIVLFFKKKQYALIFVFSLLWIIVTVFSMISTVAGQYNARIEKLNLQYKQEKLIAENDIKNMEYAEQKQEYQERARILKEDIKQLQSVLSQYTTKENIEKNKKQYNAFRWRYYSAKKELNNVLKKLTNLRKNKNITIVKKSPPDFYLWMNSIFRWKPEMIQFWLSVFPAIFIDLIAPISFAIVMFVGRENGK
jgi:hypothetical protein